MLRRWVVALSLFVFPLAIFADATSLKFDPFVIRTDRTAPVAFTVKYTAPCASARIDLNNGSVVTLTTNDGGSTWSGSLTPAQLLYGYAADDIFRNVFGYLKSFDASGNPIDNRFLVIGVAETTTKKVSVATASAGYRATGYVVNLRLPSLTSPLSDAAVQTILSTFYGSFADSYDFVSVAYALPEYGDNRDHHPTRSDVLGIGMTPKNDDALFGSAGKLLGFTRFPLFGYFDGAASAYSHELGHQWVNFVQHPLVANAGFHWPPSQMAHFIMGMALPGTSMGGDYPWRYELQADGTYKFRWEASRDEFNDIDLYLMGFLAPGSVVPQIVLGSPSQTHCDGCTIIGTRTNFSARDIIATHGSRVPDSTTSQKSFRVATIVVTRDRLLNDDEMNAYDFFARRADGHTALAVSQGLSKATNKPFWLATRGIGSLNSSIVANGNYPTINALRPEAATAGSQISIVGGPFQTGVNAYFGTTQAQVLWFTTYELRVVVPAIPAGVYDVRVTQPNGDTLWQQSFTIQ